MRYFMPLRHGKGVVSLVTTLVAVLLVLFVLPLFSFQDRPLLQSWSLRLLVALVLVLAWGLYYLLRYGLPAAASEEQLARWQERREQRQRQRQQRRALDRWLRKLLGRKTLLSGPSASHQSWYLALSAGQLAPDAAISQLWPVTSEASGLAEAAALAGLKAYTGQDLRVIHSGLEIGLGDQSGLEDWRLLVQRACHLRKGVPFQGVVLLLRTEDVSNASLMQAIGHRLRVLTAQTRGRLPLYLVVEDGETLVGFREFSATLATTEQQQPFGVVLSPEQAGVRGNYLNNSLQQLLQRLETMLTQALYQERQLARRKLLIKFPGQLEAFCDRLNDQLSHLLSGTSSILLRGIHFVGRPQIDYPVPQDGRGVPISSWLFVKHWWQDLVAKDRHLAAPGSAFMKQAWLKNGLLVGGAAVCVLAAVALQVQTYRQSESALSHLLHLSAREADRAEQVSQSGTTAALQHIQTWIEAMAQLGNRQGWLAWPGLAVADEVTDSVTGYRQRLHRESLLGYLRSELEAALQYADTSADSRLLALRVYLMLGEPQRRDEELIGQWFSERMRERWHGGDRFSPDWIKARVAEALALHPEPLAVNQGLVAEVREQLNQMPYEQQLYLRIKQLARYQGLNDFRFVTELGQEIAEVFEGGSFTIPGLYSLEGYIQVFVPELDRLLEEYEQEHWVLGSRSTQPAGQELKRIRAAVEQAYADDYVRYWQAALNELRLIQVKNLDQMLELLTELSAPASPIRKVLQASSNQTNYSLSVLRQELADKAAVAATMGGTAARLANQARKLDKLLESSGQDVATPVYLVQIRERFADLQRMVASSDGQRPPLDSVLVRLTDLQQYLLPLTAGNQPEAIYQAVIKRFDQSGADVLGQLRLSARQYPEPLRSWMLDLTDQVWSMLLQDVQQQIQVAYAADLRAFYERHLDRRYPLYKNAGQEVSLDRFAEFFRPQGVEQSFFDSYIRPFIQMNRQGWMPRTLDGRSLVFSRDMLAQFQRAQRVREGLFGGKSELQVKMMLRPVYLDANVSRFELRLDDRRLSYRHGPQRPISLEWPVESTAPGLSMSFEDYNGLLTKRTFQGAWSLVRMLDQFKLESGQEGGPYQLSYELEGRRVVYSLQGGSDLQTLVKGELQRYRLGSSLGG